MITGFNWGQMFHYTTMQSGKQVGIPAQLATQLKNEVPARLLENARMSGTMSNYMNLHEIGFGTHDNTITMWAQLSNRRHNLLQRLQFAINLLLKKRTQLFGSFSGLVDKSYLYNTVETYRQLGCKTMAFTLNSHMPYLGHCTLIQSLDSLKFIRQHTNLISVELENETYFADYIIGSNSASDYVPKIDRFISYLEDTVIPAVVRITGENMPLGLSVCDNRVAKFKYWNRSVQRLADRLQDGGYKVFLVPHIYSEGYSLEAIKKELNYQAGSLPGMFKLRITEYNAASTAGNCTQKEALEFVDSFNAVADQYAADVQATYYHSLYTQKGAHFSFLK